MSLKNFHLFNSLYESYYSRYTAGCFAPGDVVEFTKGIEKQEAFKTLPPDLQDKLSQMASASLSKDAIICVQNISLSPVVEDSPAPTTITLAYSMGGGRYYDPITIPGSLAANLKLVANSSGSAPTLPDSCKVDYTAKEYFEAEEITDDSLDKKRANDKGIVDSQTIK